MANQNQVNITGYIGQDAEYKSFSNGGGVCNFSVAVSEKWRDKNTGELKEHTEWVPVANFKQGADKLAPYLRKGQMVRVTGKFKTRSWEQDGQKRYKTEVVVQGFDTEIELLGGGQGQQQNNGYQNQAPQAPQQFNIQLSGGQPSNVKDQDIPFMPYFGG